MKRRIVIEVDSNTCFDALSKMGGDLSGVGTRLANPLLTGEMPDFRDALGLAVYGVTVVSVETAADKTMTSDQ